MTSKKSKKQELEEERQYLDSLGDYLKYSLGLSVEHACSFCNEYLGETKKGLIKHLEAHIRKEQIYRDSHQERINKMIKLQNKLRLHYAKTEKKDMWGAITED